MRRKKDHKKDKQAEFRGGGEGGGVWDLKTFHFFFLCFVQQERCRHYLIVIIPICRYYVPPSPVKYFRAARMISYNMKENDYKRN